MALICQWVPQSWPSLEVLSFSLNVSRVAIHKRFSTNAVQFLKSCFAVLIKQIALADAKPLVLFGRLLVLDSTQWQIHRKLSKHYPGSGGAASKAVCKLQTIIEPLTGRLVLMDYVAGTKPDQGYSKNIPALLRPRDLLLFDLGYYSVEVFRQIDRKGAFFIIPVYYNVIVQDRLNERFTVASLLSRQKTAIVDLQLTIGASNTMPLRLIAIQLSSEKANRLRRKVRQDYRRQRGGEPPKERLRFCNWTVLITNVPQSILSPKQIADIYSTRWQIEIFFRDAKSVLKLNIRCTSKKNRFEIQLLACLFVAALLFYVHRCFISAKSSLEISLNKLIKRFCNIACEFSDALHRQAFQTFGGVLSIVRRLVRMCLKYRQPSRKTPLEILHNCGLS